MKEKKQKIIGVLLLLIIIFCFFIRLQFIQRADNMAINDGGMFQVMTTELVQNHFSLPRVTEYNHSSFPYAYSPLSFYIAGALNTIFKIDLITVERYFPLFFNLLAIYFFFLLAREFLQSNARALIATLVISISTNSFTWLIMGGGLTRSPAYAFCILSIYFILHGIRTHDWKSIVAAGVSCGLTFCFHIETGYFTALFFVFTTLFYARNLFGAKCLILTGAITTLMYGPFFLMVVLQN